MAERLQISLDVELTDPIQGRVGDNAGNGHEFSGWLEMSSLIEDLCKSARSANEPTQHKPITSNRAEEGTNS